ncbi:hypothetical protein [Ralstonia soli]|uniref:N-acetyltransferase domain-containing protein n=1 Tax=Ralstonia soli TaxID=2953896 RepID=A0ABT1AHT6_9RALS|nr:hypothetical protein [Ralstonia soli]MCO5397964.1 hypothetical protein [Ralstonia soli]
MLQHDSSVDVGSDSEVITLSPLAKAVAKALSEPFLIEGVTGCPVFVQLNYLGEATMVVYANGHPSKTLPAVIRSLHEKARVSDVNDPITYFDGRSSSTNDLLARPGAWPETSVHHVAGLGMSASQRHCFVLCDQNVEIGFCTVELRIDQIFEQGIPAVHVELGSDFIVPEMRDRGLSRMWAKAIGKATVAMLMEFRNRCERHGITEECTFPIIIKREAISESGKRFGRKVLHELEVQLDVAQLLFGSTNDLVSVSELDGSAFYRAEL